MWLDIFVSCLIQTVLDNLRFAHNYLTWISQCIITIGAIFGALQVALYSGSTSALESVCKVTGICSDNTSVTIPVPISTTGSPNYSNSISTSQKVYFSIFIFIFKSPPILSFKNSKRWHQLLKQIEIRKKRTQICLYSQ